MFTAKSLIPLLFSFIGGMSTIIGAFIIFFTKGNNKKLLTFSLSFSAGVMITVSLTDLYPCARETFLKEIGDFRGVLYSLLFMLIGILIALLINIFIPQSNTEKYKSDDNSLYKIGIITMVALILHNFPEGITTFISGYENRLLGIYITIAIALHNIPEGISIAVPIYFSTKSKAKAFKYTFLSGIAEPIGAFIAFLFLKPFINNFILAVCFSIISGIMLYISFTELIPTSIKTGYKRVSVFSLFLGIFIIPLSHAFF